MLNIISSPINVTLEWVKAHHLDTFIQAADELAKQALLLNDLSSQRCPQSFMTYKISKIILNKFF